MSFISLRRRREEKRGTVSPISRLNGGGRRGSGRGSDGWQEEKGDSIHFYFYRRKTSGNGEKRGE